MMNKVIIALAFALPVSCSALNLDIGYPVNADRLGLSSHVNFNLDCRSRKVEIIEESNVFVRRQVMNNVSKMCYRDDGFYNVTIYYGTSKNTREQRNMLITQPGVSIYR